MVLLVGKGSELEKQRNRIYAIVQAPACAAL